MDHAYGADDVLLPVGLGGILYAVFARACVQGEYTLPEERVIVASIEVGIPAQHGENTWNLLLKTSNYAFSTPDAPHSPSTAYG